MFDVLLVAFGSTFMIFDVMETGLKFNDFAGLSEGIPA